MRTEVEDKPARKLETPGKETNSRRSGWEERGGEGGGIIPSNLFLRVILVYSRESNKRCKYIYSTVSIPVVPTFVLTNVRCSLFVAFKKMAETVSYWVGQKAIAFLFFRVQTNGEYFTRNKSRCIIQFVIFQARFTCDYFRKYQKYEKISWIKFFWHTFYYLKIKELSS